jgi:hypothetical protein
MSILPPGMEKTEPNSGRSAVAYLVPTAAVPSLFGQDPADAVGHHDSGAGRSGGGGDDLGDGRGRMGWYCGVGAGQGDVVVDAGGKEHRMAEDGRLGVPIRASFDGQRQRNLQRDDHDGKDVHRGQNQPRAEAHSWSSSGEAKRKPTPRTVLM